jgi:hypothetical protein
MYYPLDPATAIVLQSIDTAATVIERTYDALSSDRAKGVYFTVAVVTISLIAFAFGQTVKGLRWSAKRWYQLVFIPQLGDLYQQPVSLPAAVLVDAVGDQQLVIMPSAALELNEPIQPKGETAAAIATKPAVGKLPASTLSKNEMIWQIQQRSGRKVPGIWKLRREALEKIYATV